MNQIKNRRVFIPNLSSHDFSDAKRYGELVFITKGEQSKYNVNSMCRTWTGALAESEPTDYILLTSLSILCCIGCSVFSTKHGRLNLLLWKGGKYIARELIHSEIEKELIF